MPKVSIIITAHNQEQYLRDCLNSFYGQKTKYSFEIILINDNSKDGTEKLIREEYPEVGYFKVCFDNRCETRNFGLTKANGDYIGWFDGDDYPDENYIEELASALSRNRKVDFVYPKVYYPGYTLDDMFITDCYAWEFSKDLLKIKGYLGTVGLIRKRVIQNAKWDESKELLVYDDWDYYLQLTEKGSTGMLVSKTRYFFRDVHNPVWQNVEALRKSREYVFKKHRVEPKKIDWTFVSVISREFTLKRYFSCLSRLDMPKDKMHWFIYVDSEDKSLIKKLKRYAEREGKNFYSWRMFITYREPLADTFYIKRAKRQRKNFITIMRELRNIQTTTPYFFMLEDDTIVKNKNAFWELSRHLKEGVAMVLGVEASRSDIKCLGVAKLKWSGDKLLERHTLKPKRKGIEEVDGTGWYCFVGRLSAFRDEYLPDVFYSWANSDVISCWKLRQWGWKILVNWGIWCDHIYLKDGKIKARSPREAIEYTFKMEPL